jgi:hypothetical protein
MEFGRSVLEQRRLAYLSQQSSQDRKLGRRPTSLEMDNDQEEESIYVGDQVLSVLIREGDGVYGVVVRR